MIRKYLLALLAMTSFVVPANAATINTYTSAAAFDALATSMTTEMFTGLSGTATTYDFGPGSIARGNTTNAGSHNNNWRGRPTTTLADVIKFDNKINAWGGFIDTQVGGNGVGISINVVLDLFDNNTLVGSVGVGSDPNISFFGFTSDVKFDTVRLFSPGGTVIIFVSGAG